MAVLMMNTNLMMDSDVDDPVVEDNMVDDGLFVGLFVDDSSCKLTVVYARPTALVGLVQVNRVTSLPSGVKRSIRVARPYTMAL